MGSAINLELKGKTYYSILVTGINIINYTNTISYNQMVVHV